MVHSDLLAVTGMGAVNGVEVGEELTLTSVNRHRYVTEFVVVTVTDWQSQAWELLMRWRWERS